MRCPTCGKNMHEVGPAVEYCWACGTLVKRGYEVNVPNTWDCGRKEARIQELESELGDLRVLLNPDQAMIDLANEADGRIVTGLREKVLELELELGVLRAKILGQEEYIGILKVELARGEETQRQDNEKLREKILAFEERIEELMRLHQPLGEETQEERIREDLDAYQRIHG